MICKYCNVNTCAISKTGKYKQFCSSTCQNKHTINKRNATNLLKFGTTNPMSLSSVKEKRQSTNIERYGVANPFVLPEIQQKHKDTCISRYGVSHSSQAEEIKEKQKIAWKKYENGHPLSDLVVREKRKNTLLENYGVEHPIQYQPIREKIEQKCVELYGVSNASLNEEIKKKISLTKSNGSTKWLDDTNWLNESIPLLGIRGIAELLGVSYRIVRQYAEKHKIDYGKRSGRSAFEEQVCLYIESIYSGEILVSNRSIIGKEIDIFLPALNLAFECNGTYWHSELNGRGRSFHLERSKLCNNKGIHLTHIWEHDWNNKREILKSRISSLLNTNKRIYGRKCTIVELDNSTTSLFMDTNHIQGKCVSTINLGLMYDNNLVSVMTFGKSRFSSKYQYELLRFANAININVIGAASKLFKYFLKKYKPETIVSYSDKSFNRGTLYNKLGFEYSHTSAPSYHYTKDYSKLENRVKFQKHKLAKLLENFDNTLSEWDNMQHNGYDRIWDCGHDTWVFKAVF